MMKRKSSSEAGFTLLETLIAFAILSTSLVVAYQVFTDGFRARTRAAMTLNCEERASQELSSLVAIARHSGTIQAANWIDEDGYQTSVTLGGPIEADPQAYELSELRVAVTGPDNRATVSLSSFINLQGPDAR